MHHSFLGFPSRLPDNNAPRAVIFSAGHGTTYPGKDSQPYALGASAIRTASLADAGFVGNWDFDLGGPLFDGSAPSVIDFGEVPTTMHDNEGNRSRIEAQTRSVLGAAAVPILLGGDDSVPIPFLSAFANHGPVWVLQIDAHIDWRDTVDGERFGYSNPMRRISEMPHVAGIVQVGMRSVGSASNTELEAALAYGSHIITAREIHSHGVDAALNHIPLDAKVVITLDCDGLDPSIMPGVAARTPGGLTYTQAIDLITGVGARAKIAGFDLVEFFPPADHNGVTALTAARLIVNAVGTIVRQAW
ncbi:agmatinase [Mesorhizobium sp. NBSH29]|uniref:agmatinase n=1 Tax=Mesorhizobium sp. NBSH29 TaxID=2654249 RepID=UPI0018969C62|nr:agmatinase [Mesorhizobium sp. NBSH29]QPC87742.1 agmatinase [Mesorhizobium sp. NBSH29]